MTMEISLNGKNALVGGSTSGIGKAIALQLANCGANVTLVGRNEEKLQETLKELRAEVDQHHTYIVTDYLDHEKYVSQMDEYFEKRAVDILVNNTQGPNQIGRASCRER